MKFTPTEIVLFFCLAVLLLFNINPQTPVSPSFSNLSFLQDYIQKIIPAGDDVVILFTSGAVYNSERRPLYFTDSIYISAIEKELIDSNYTFISINTTCLAGNPLCITEFTDLALAIAKLNPKAIIYKGIDSGIANENFKEIIESKGIPLYSYGTEVIINYEVYAGPDNIKLGELAFDAVKDNIQPSQTALYIETTRGLGSPETGKFDNGFPRINSIRNLMTNAGVETAGTLFTQWSEAKTYSGLLNYLQSNPTPDYIFTPSEGTTQGVVTALEAAGVQDQVTVVALDFTDKIKTLIEEDKIYAGVSQQMAGQVKYIVEQIKSDAKLAPHKKLFAGPYITKEILEETEDIKTLY